MGISRQPLVYKYYTIECSAIQLKEIGITILVSLPLLVFLPVDALVVCDGSWLWVELEESIDGEGELGDIESSTPTPISCLPLSVPSVGDVIINLLSDEDGCAELGGPGPPFPGGEYSMFTLIFFLPDQEVKLRFPNNYKKC